MAKEIKFRIRLSVDGKEQLVTATTSSRDLRKNLDAARSSAIRFRDAMLTMNQMGQAFQGLISGLSQVNSALSSYTQAYATQEQNEQRLATVMRERMNATAADVEQMKALAAAQQQLGIIGDEVQLAGMQQLATFIHQKDTLAQLVPAMNNLIAQQKGYNATAGDAQTIGNLLGKAMQGQATALRRVGISFDETQEKVLKFGTESERASMLAEIITQNVGNMNAELRQTTSGQMKALSNTMGDLSEKVGAVMMPFQGIMQQVTQLGFLFLSLGQIVSTTRGVMIALGAAIKSTGIASLFFSKQAYIQTAATLMLNGASKATALSLAALKVALRGLLIASGIGAVIAGLTIVVEKLMNASDKTSDSLGDMADSAQEMNDAYRQAQSSIELNIAKLKDLIQQKEAGKNVSKQEKEMLSQLNNTYGETMGYFSNVSDWYKALTANSKAYCEQIVDEARTRELANKIAETSAQRDQIFFSYPDPSTAGRAVAGLDAQISSMKKEMEMIVSRMSKRVMPVRGSATPPTTSSTSRTSRTGRTNATTTAADDKKKPLELIEEAKTYKDLENNLRYYQEQLDNTDISEKATIESLAKKKKAVEDQIKAFNDLQDAATAERSIETLNDAEITTRKQLNAKLEYYNKLLVEGDEKQRESAQRSIKNLNKMAAAWDEQLARLDAPGSLDTINDIKDIDAAIQFYSDQQQREDADKIYKTQGIINALTEKKRVLQLSIDLPDMQREVTAIENLTGTERRVKIRAMGFDEIMGKVRELNELMELPGVTDFQKRQLSELNDIYKSWSKQVIKSFDTVKESWSSIKGIGDGVESITEALDGNKNAWQVITGVIDGFIQLYEGVMGIVKIIQMMTAVTKIQTAATITGAAATGAATAAETTDAATQEVAALAKLPLIAANKAAAASYMELASAAFFAAHAYIPFAGFGIAAGFVAAATAMTEAIGAMPFANGGIVGGTSYNGDKLFARLNSGEMVLNKTQQAKLWNMINNGTAIGAVRPATAGVAGVAGMAGGNVRFELEGRKLVGVLSNETRVGSRSGRRTNIKL